MKPHRGMINNWFKLEIGPIQQLKIKEDLGIQILDYVILGVFDQRWPAKLSMTSAIIKHEGNEIETLNSRYTLGIKKEEE